MKGAIDVCQKTRIGMKFEWSKSSSVVCSLRVVRCIIQLFPILCRHSASDGIKSMIVGYNIWVMLWSKTKYDKSSIYSHSSRTHITHHLTLSFSIQTLTELKLGWNQIGAEGTHYLSDALKQNKVWQILYLFILFSYSYHPSFNSFLCHTDTHHTQPRS